MKANHEKFTQNYSDNNCHIYYDPIGINFLIHVKVKIRRKKIVMSI